MRAGGQELDLLSGAKPGTDLTRPHRSYALHGAALFGVRGVVMKQAEATVIPPCATTVSRR